MIFDVFIKIVYIYIYIYIEKSMTQIYNFFKKHFIISKVINFIFKFYL